jgi:hypothetical protein
LSCEIVGGGRGGELGGLKQISFTGEVLPNKSEKDLIFEVFGHQK